MSARRGPVQAAALLLAALVLAPLPVAAGAWIVDGAAGRIGFDYVIDGKESHGHFARFTGTGELEPATPATARLELRIQTASIDLGSPLVSAFATSAEWFDSVNHPEAVYRLDRLEPIGGDRFRAVGELTIRGHREVVAAEVTLAFEPGSARASGSVTVDRRKFGLGVGPSALIVTVDPSVTVLFDMTARPAP